MSDNPMKSACAHFVGQDEYRNYIWTREEGKFETRTLNNICPYCKPQPIGKPEREKLRSYERVENVVLGDEPTPSFNGKADDESLPPNCKIADDIITEMHNLTPSTKLRAKVAISIALNKARLDALEEAALVAESDHKMAIELWMQPTKKHVVKSFAAIIAKSIRSLKKRRGRYDHQARWRR